VLYSLCRYAESPLLAFTLNTRKGAVAQKRCGLGIHILGYDLLQEDNGSWTLSKINAGNIGGLFRIEHLGVPAVTDRFVAWLNAYYDRNNPGHSSDQASTKRQSARF